jgi:hypothetical protein
LLFTSPSYATRFERSQNLQGRDILSTIQDKVVEWARTPTRIVNSTATVADGTKPAVRTEAAISLAAYLRAVSLQAVTGFVSWSHQLATIYAQAAIPVLPFRFVPKARPGTSKWNKVPMTSCGHKDASADVAVINGWSNLWANPEVGVGIPLSEISHFALDGDLHGLGDGNAKLAQVRADFDINTGKGSVATRTGSGGTHHLLRLLPPLPQTLRKPKQWPVGVLDLVYNGWIVAPGSVAPDGSRWLPMLDGALPQSQEELIQYIAEWACRVSSGLVELASPRLLETLKGKPRATKSECELPGDLSIAEKHALSAIGRGLVEQMVRDLTGRVKGDGRSLVALKACASAAPLVWAGILDEQWVRDCIDEVQPGLETEDNCVKNGFEQGNTLALRELAKIRRRGTMAAAVLGVRGANAVGGVRSAGQLIIEQLMEATEKAKVLWNGDSYRTLLDASWAFAAASVNRVFASSVSGKLSVVGFVNGRATAENFMTADHVRDLLQRTVLILEPVPYDPANALAPKKVPPGTARIKTLADGKRKNEVVVKTAWTCEAVANALNAAEVLTNGVTGEPNYDSETTVWLPVEKLDSLTLKLAVERIMATQDGVVLQEMLGVFQGPQMLPNGTVVTTSGLHTARGTAGMSGQEVAFADMGELAGLLEEMPLDRAKAVLKEYIDLFPYSEPEDGAVLAALAVTGFCRLAFKLAPLTLIDAPVFGAGKTFAAERIAGLNGTAPLAIACTNKSRDSGDEMRKRIETECIIGQAGFKILDDVPGGELPNVESFRTMLTSNSAKCSVRVLGESRSVEVSPVKFTWIATGNNVRVSEDMVRRSVHARLDRDRAQLWGWVGEKAAEIELDRIRDEPRARAAVVSAILSLLQHVRQAGPRLPRLSNFESWSALPREVAHLVMGADPVVTQVRLRANDEKAIEHAEITTALLALIGTEAEAGTAGGFMLVRDIAALIAGASDIASLVAPAGLPEHIQELRRHFEGATGTALERRLSAWLRQHKDRRTAPDEDGLSYAMVCRRMRDPEHRNMRVYWGIAVHRELEEKR